jgi:hypothetical protein
MHERSERERVVVSDSIVRRQMGEGRVSSRDVCYYYYKCNNTMDYSHNLYAMSQQEQQQ